MGSSKKKCAKSKPELLQEAIRRNADKKPLPSGASIDLGATHMPPEVMRAVASEMIEKLRAFSEREFPDLYEAWIREALADLEHTVSTDWACEDALTGLRALVRVLAYSDAMVGVCVHEKVSESLGHLVCVAKLSMTLPSRELNEVVAVVCLGVVLAHPVIKQMELVLSFKKDHESVSIEMSDFPDRWSDCHNHVAMTWLLSVANCRSAESVCLIGLKKPDVNIDRIRHYAKDQLSAKHTETELTEKIMRFVKPMIEESMVHGHMKLAIHVLKKDLMTYLRNMLAGIMDDGTPRLADRIAAQVALSSADEVGMRYDTAI